MRQDQRTGAKLQRTANNLAWIDRRVVDGANALHLIGDQRIALVEKQNPELLAVRVGHRRSAIVQNVNERRERLSRLDLAARQSRGDRFCKLDFDNRRFT